LVSAAIASHGAPVVLPVVAVVAVVGVVGAEAGAAPDRALYDAENGQKRE
jgi:hypothetical protein